MNHELPGEQFAVRDNRGREWFWADHAVIDTYGPTLGVFSIAVYMYLARRVDDKEQKCWPSYQTIADALKISRPMAINACQDLQTCGLIRIEERLLDDGQQRTNYFFLLPRDAWLHPSQVQLPSDLAKQKKREISREAGGGKQDLPPSKQRLPRGKQDLLGGKQGLLPSKQDEPPSKQRLPKQETTQQETEKKKQLTTNSSTPVESFSDSPQENETEIPVVDVVLNSSLSVANADIDALVSELIKFRIEESTARQLVEHPNYCRAWIRYAGKSENRNIGPGLIVKRVRDLVFPPDHEEEERKIQMAAAREEQLRHEAEERNTRVKAERQQLAAEAVELDQEYSRFEAEDRAIVDADAERAISALLGGRAVTAEQRDSARRGATRRFLAEREEEERERSGMSEEELAGYEKRRAAEKILSNDAELTKLIPRFDAKILRRVKKAVLTRAAGAGLEIHEEHPTWPSLQRQAIREMAKSGDLSVESYL